LEEKESSEGIHTDDMSTIRRSEVTNDNRIEEENHCLACREALK
jgi:hypothetical protein